MPAHLEPDSFLLALTRLFEQHAGDGSVWVTMKRTNLRPRKGATEEPPEGEACDFCCLVRATDGSHKFSTAVRLVLGALSVPDAAQVKGREVARFHAAFSLIQKAHTGALRQKTRTRERTPKA